MLPHAWPLFNRLLDVGRQDTTDFLDNTLGLLGSSLSILAEQLPAVPQAWVSWAMAQRYVAAAAPDWTTDWSYPTDIAITYGGPRGVFHRPVEISPGVLIDFADELTKTIEAIFEETAETETIPATRVITSFLHFARGGIDRVLPRLITALVKSFSAAKTEELIRALAVSLSAALVYNAAGTISVIFSVVGSADAPAFISRWFGELGSLSKPVDIKLASLGLSCLIADTAAGTIPPAITAVLPAVVALAIMLVRKESAELTRVAAQVAERAARTRGSSDSSGRAESGGDAGVESDEDVGGDAAGADDGSYEESEFDADSNEGSDYDDDDPDTVESPLDHVHTLLFFSRAINALGASPVWHTVAAGLSADAGEALRACEAQAAMLQQQGVVVGELGPTENEKLGIPLAARTPDGGGLLTPR